jgi:hypothetical protein
VQEDVELLEDNKMTATVATGVIAQAIKASGAIVQLAPEEFLTILTRSEQAVVVQAEVRFWRRKYQYLTSYKGLVFVTTTPNPLVLSPQTEVILAEEIWTPG